jgi:hypothetical protein
MRPCVGHSALHLASTVHGSSASISTVSCVWLSSGVGCCSPHLPFLVQGPCIVRKKCPRQASFKSYRRRRRKGKGKALSSSLLCEFTFTPRPQLMLSNRYPNRYVNYCAMATQTDESMSMWVMSRAVVHPNADSTKPGVTQHCIHGHSMHAPFLLCFPERAQIQQQETEHTTTPCSRACHAHISAHPHTEPPARVTRLHPHLDLYVCVLGFTSPASPHHRKT